MHNSETEKLLANAIETLGTIKPKLKRQREAAAFLIRHAALLQSDLNRAGNTIQQCIAGATPPNTVKRLYTERSDAQVRAVRRALLIKKLQEFLKDVPVELEAEIKNVVASVSDEEAAIRVEHPLVKL